VNYVGAGTVEFIADASEGLRPDRVWFMEMNTRLQVEHPVTEAITGEDLVEWQLRVASGEPLPKRQDELSIRGWAMEARLYAENPTAGFLPSIGRLERMRLPTGVRVDSGVEEGGEVTPFYDPMIAKLIVHAPSRPAAAEKLAAACGSVEIWPVRTNAAFLARAAAHAAFVAGRIDTGFIERHAGELVPAAEPSSRVAAAAAAALVPPPGQDPWEALIGFRSAAPPDLRVAVDVGGAGFFVEIEPDGVAADIAGVKVLFLDGEAWPFAPPSTDQRLGAAGGGDGAVLSPMPGRVVTVDVRNGDAVSKGQRLAVLEAMKMEHALTAPFDGMVENLIVAAGDQVAEGVLLARITPKT
jgi:3-methylcrotonyl-CoA carboxylase alpha subunit